MVTVNNFLLKQQLESYQENKKQEISDQFFLDFLESDHGISKTWLSFLSDFLIKTELSYWDLETLKLCLDFLEKKPDKTIESISRCQSELNVGISEFYRLFHSDQFEKQNGKSLGEKIYEISNVFHPSYLRLSEHCYNNLLVVFYDLVRNQKRNKQRELKNRFSCLKDKGLNFLTKGYNDKVRNAIAHGELSFESMNILYGPENHQLKLSFSELIILFHDLVRTVQTIYFSLLIFISRYKQKNEKSESSIPYEIISKAAFSPLERKKFNYLGAAESKIISGETVLNLFLESEFFSRDVIILDALRISRNVLELGGSNYPSFYIEINSNKKNLALVRINASKLAMCLSEDMSVTDLSKVFDDTPMIWTDSSKMMRRYRTAKCIWDNLFKDSIKEIFNDTKSLIYNDPYLTKYRIRDYENCSVDGTPRLHIYASLERSLLKISSHEVKMIVRSIISIAKKKLINSNPSSFKRNIPQPKRCVYIWVTLYQQDAPIQWLKSGGWMSGNILCTAEWIKDEKYSPIYIKKPQETWSGIRFRFEIDKEEYNKALNSVVNLLDNLKGNH